MKYIVQDPESAAAPVAVPSTLHQKLSAPPQGGVSEGSAREGSRAWRARLAICVLACGVLALALYTCALLLRDQRRPVICATEQCLHTASRILSSLNRSVSPCEDFYEFACGGWMARNPVPEYASSWDQLAILRERLVHDLRDLLAPANTTSSEPDPDPEPKPPIVVPRSVLKARALYAACMDVERLEELGTRPITSVLQSLGLSAQVPAAPEPAVEGEGASEPRTRWEVVAGRARRSLGLSTLLSVQVAEDVRNTSRNRLVVEQVSPGFSERYLLGRAHFAHEVAQYRRYIRAVLELADPALAQRDHDLDTATDNILDFSTSLAQIMTPVEVRRSGSHLFHEVSLRQFVAGAQEGPPTWAQHNWTEYLNLVFENTSVTLAWEEDRIIVMDLPYLQKLSILLHDTPPHVIERFLWWSVFSTLAPMTLAAFRELGFQFSREVFGLRSRTPRWKTCAANVNANFGMALSYLYVRRHFDPDSRDKALEMLEDVREAFGESVRQLQWMDAGTRARTLHKLQAIRTFVGYPAHLLEPKHLDSHYNHTEVVEGELFETYLRLTDGSVRKSLDALRERPDRNRWVAAPTTVNAFYSATLNTVTFPAGILQPPFYGNGIEAINYGSIGAIMGHEITHGFDDQGRRYDAEGNLRQWWSAGTLEHWSERVTCIVQQYGAYRMRALPNMTVHGGNTQGENIADNGGVRAALNAYRRLERRQPHHAALRLPALAHFTPTQLFFLGFAQIWCGNSTAGALKSKLVEGVHSPNRVRVLGALANSAEFAAAFQCAPAAPMNPSNKCLLW